MSPLQPPPFLTAPLLDATGYISEPWKRWFLKLQTQLVLNGILTVKGAYNLTFTITGTTALTLPTSGLILNAGQVAARVSLGL